MKRILPVCICLLLCACASAKETAMQAANTAPTPVAAATAPIAATPMPMPPVRSRAYGAEMMLVADGNGFSGTLRYPQGGVQPVNRAIADWAGGEFARLEAKAALEPADEDGIRARMEIDYDAYFYQERFIGVRFTGTYAAAATRVSEPVMYVYNYDLDESRRVTLSDVIDQTQMDAVAGLVSGRLMQLDAAAISEGNMLTAATMRDFVMRGDGIEWLFLGKTGVVGVFIDYAALTPYLAIDRPVAAEASGNAGGAADAERQAISLYDGVHVRSLPSHSKGEILGTVNAGETLGVVKANVQNGWHEVSWQGRTAFVAANLVQLSGEETAYTNGWVTSGYLHVRACASVASELLGTMQYQERVRILDINPIDGWYKIWFEGDIAFVNAQYVAIGFYPPETQTASVAAEIRENTEEPRILRQASVPIAGVGTCLTDGVLVRGEPDDRAAVLGTLSADCQVYIMEEACAPGWDMVFVHTQWNSGYIGYAEARYVRSFLPNGEIAP